jgi:hypothetical protein
VITPGCKCGAILRTENDEEGELRYVHPLPLCRLSGVTSTIKPILLDNEDMRGLFTILDDCRAEVERREELYGPQDYDLIDPKMVDHFLRLSMEMEMPNAARLANGKLSHFDMLRSAFYYAGACKDPAALREAWIRVAAIAIHGVESLDRRIRDEAQSNRNGSVG